MYDRGILIRKPRLALATGLIAIGLLVAPTVALAHGRRVRRCVVPRVTGLTVSVARRRVRHAGCRVGRVRRPRHLRGGRVWLQIPAGRRHVRRGTKVRLFLGRGHRPIRGRRLRYRAKVDPSFTQNPTNPLTVTYDYSASATESDGSLQLNLATGGALPAGVLDFYSQTEPGSGGQELFCSINVGGATSSGQCPITYGQFGAYRVTTEYIPNQTTAVTETDVETIAAIPTTTTLTVTKDSCGTTGDAGLPYPPGPDGIPYCAYTMSTSVVDANGNTPPGSTTVRVSAPQSDGNTATLSTRSQGCTFDVIAAAPAYQVTAELFALDCAFESRASELSASGSWTFNATSTEPPGWTDSVSAPAVLSAP